MEAAAAEQVAGGHDLARREQDGSEGGGDKGMPYSIQFFLPLSSWEKIGEREKLGVVLAQSLSPPTGRARRQGFRI